MRTFFIHIYKSLIGSAEGIFLPLTPKDDLVVVCMHSTPSAYNIAFENLIHWVRKKYHVISPQDLERFFKNPEAFQKGPYFLFTFDDGLRNNLQAAKILSKHGLSALFFVVPDFIDSSDPKNYYRTNIRPVKEKIERSDLDCTPMSWSELSEVIEMGHFVGSHTFTHQLNPRMSDENISLEIVSSRQKIEEQIGTNVDHFASPNNTLQSVDSKISGLIKNTYTFHYTTVPGLFRQHSIGSHFIYRRNIEVHWKPSTIKFALGLFDLRRWREQRNALSRY